jgi:hypothetical protein
MDSTPSGSSPTPPPTGSSPTPPPTGGLPGSGDLVYPATPAKDPVLILVLNLLLFGCVGYFMIGQKMKGIVAIVADLVVGIPTCGIGVGAVAIVGAIDGYLQAQQLQAGHPVGQWTFFNDHK